MQQRLSIIRWTRTQSQFVALLGLPEQFRSESLKRHNLGTGETLLVGERTQGLGREWYALAYDKAEMEFDEARNRAIATLDAENRRRATGKPSFVS